MTHFHCWRDRVHLVLSFVSFLVLAPTPSMSQETYFQLSSPAFADSGLMATKYAGKNPSNASCIGDNISPPLRWSNVPAGTRSFAFIMYDQEGRNGLGVSHWIAYGIPASTSSLEEGAANKEPRGFLNGANISGQPVYLGPCPPKGSGPHHYVFTIIATKLEPDALKSGLAMPQLLQALDANTLGASGLVGRFGH